jgi:TPR repeat protein
VQLIRRILPVFAVLLLLVTPAGAQYFQKGLEAYNRGDYATALREWRPLAAQGHARAQYNLGFMYASGQGVPQDYAEAVKWFRRSHPKVGENQFLIFCRSSSENPFFQFVIPYCNRLYNIFNGIGISFCHLCHFFQGGHRF